MPLIVYKPDGTSSEKTHAVTWAIEANPLTGGSGKCIVCTIVSCFPLREENAGSSGQTPVLGTAKVIFEKFTWPS